jgi:aspartyl-tRNA(Asn)/glutamyl-tRNA(Gln) amidotransferase subunit A
VSELGWISIAELSQLLRLREASAAEALDAVCDRRKQTEPLLHAFARTMDASARQDAARADAELARGEVRGPLHGVPIAVEDVCWTGGVPTEAGSRVLEGWTPTRDAAVVRSLRAAGAVIVGKTVTHELGYGQDVSPTRCAWDPARHPGGSSAGSAVAVATGCAHAAIGTDTGGSLRIPAALNGVVCLKPTFGQVSLDGLVGMSPSFDTVGPMTRSVRDAALMLEAIAGAGDARATIADEPLAAHPDLLDGDVRGRRVGVLVQPRADASVEAGVAACMEAARDVLEQRGVTLVELQIEGVEAAAAIAMTIVMVDMSEAHREQLRRDPERYGQGTRVMLEAGQLIGSAAYARAHRLRAALQRRVRDAFAAASLDALLTPTAPRTAPLVRPPGADDDALPPPELPAYCFLANALGLPALTLPAGHDDAGLPVGMQLLGRPFGEDVVFQIAYCYEQATSWHRERAPTVMATTVNA